MGQFTALLFYNAVVFLNLLLTFLNTCDNMDRSIWRGIEVVITRRS